MITLFKFFSLIFSIQKNYSPNSPPQLTGDIETVSSSSINDTLNCNSGKSATNLFNIEWLLEGLCSKNSYLLLDCLSSLKCIDIEKYNSLNTSNYLHIFYLKNEIKTVADYKRLGDFAKDLNKSTFYQIINNCKNSVLKNKLIYLENKVNLKSLKKRNKLQSFFQYINTSFQTPKDLEYERDIIVYEIKRFFNNDENKISNSFEVNQAHTYSVNYFGSFIKNLLYCKLPAKTLIQMLSPIFTSEKNLLFFLSSLSLAKENVTIFNNVQDDDKALLELKFNQIKANCVANVFLGENYNFIHTQNIELSQDSGHALYLFDCPIMFSRIILKSKKSEFISKNLISYLDSIKNNINPKFQEKLAFFESMAISFSLESSTKSTLISKI